MNLFELFVKVGVDDQASGKLSSITGKLGKGLKTAAKIGTAAVSVAAAGITALTTAAVKNYAEYEQLVGGVETLFKNSADTVQQYAANAYKTAGLSANEYMSTVTSFSASLLQSLSGDTEAAAKYADMAISDMSDNANKMGTDMELIQNAYQGFAKQNYTMLDNLKLGYGGTKTEMERLIADASKLDSSIDANDMSFGNIVKSINAVQREMGIYGTTALEAEKTISGSLNSMKSAWSNLLTGIADDNADFDTLINNMVESVVTFADNLMPRIQQALSGVGTLVQGLAPQIAERLPELISTALPNLVSGIETLLSSVIEVLPSLLDTLLTTAVPSLLSGIESISSVLLENLPTIIETLASGLETALPLLIETAVSLIGKIGKILPELISSVTEVLPTLFKSVADALLKDGLPVLIDVVLQLLIALIEQYPQWLEMIMTMMSDLYAALIPALINSLPLLLSAIVPLIEALFKALPDILIMGATASLGLMFAAITGLFKAYGEDIKSFFSETIPQLITDIIAWFESLPEKIGFIVGSVIKFFMDLPENIRTWLWETINKIKEWIANMKSTVQQKVPEIISKITGFFDGLPGKIKQVGKNIVDGLWNGISSGWTWLKNKVNNLVNSLVSGVKKGLGIKSPSRVFRDQIGKQMALGLGIGWENEFANVKDDIEGDFSNLVTDADYGITTSSTSVSDFGGGSSVYGRGGSQSVNVTVGIDDSANAMGLARALLPFLKIAEKEVYA